MRHSHFTLPPKDLLASRLEVFLENVNTTWQSSSLVGNVFQDDIRNLYDQSIETFLETLDESIVASSLRIYAGSPSDPNAYNTFFAAIQKDLQILYLELGALDKLVSASFNGIVSGREQVLNRSKTISNKLADYLLYADSNLGGGFFFGDSYSTASKIEIGSSLAETEECFHSSEEGAVFLPLDGDPVRPKIKSYIINQNSNGTAGNEQELDAPSGHIEISEIGDGAANTWFEYEKINELESSVPLLLDLTIVLNEISIINHIHINPINFGTPSPVRILQLETSTNGKDYRSIKEEIPVLDFFSNALDEEEKEFQLSSSSSKFSGQGFYSFLPRKAQYIHVVLEQDTPYAIRTKTSTIEKLRYAIGIRDINILSRRFKPLGSLVSQPFATQQEIKKLALWSVQNPIQKSVLTNISHSVSHDDGAAWTEIQPQNRTGYKVSELVNYNTIAKGAITTKTPVLSLRHKLSLERFKEAFDGQMVIEETKISKTETIDFSPSSKIELQLEETPIPESLNLMLPYMGSFGCPRAAQGASVPDQSKMCTLDHISFKVGVPGDGSIRFAVPYRSIPNLASRLRVFVNGEQWEYSAKDVPGRHTSYGEVLDENGKAYFLNNKGKELQFGYNDGTDQFGAIPASGSKVEICLDGDNPRLELIEQNYVLHLGSPSDGFKDNVQVVFFDSFGEVEREELRVEVPVETGAVVEEEHPPPQQSQYEAALAEGSKNVISAVKKKKTLFFFKEKGESKFSGLISGIKKIVSSRKDSKHVVPRPPEPVMTIQGLAYPPSENIQTSADINPQANLDSLFVPASGGSSPNVPDPEPIVTPPPKAKSYEVHRSFADSVNPLERDERRLPVPDILEDYSIEEIDLETGLPVETPLYTVPVDFIDGSTEFLNAGGELVEGRYTFDFVEGRTYMHPSLPSDRKIVYVFKRIRSEEIDNSLWEYYQDPITGKPDTRVLVLDPRAVKTTRRVKKVTTATPLKHVSLVDDRLDFSSSLGHSWYKQRVIEGSIELSESIFEPGATPTELGFVNGKAEFDENILVYQEPVASSTETGTVTFDLVQPDVERILEGSSIGFEPKRDEDQEVSFASQFTEYVETVEDIDAEGKWTYVVHSTTKVVSIHVSVASGLNEHFVSYEYKVQDLGLDVKGRYSVDYGTGTVYLADPVTLDTEHIFAFEVSLYSAFYNIVHPIVDSEVETIDTENNTVRLTEEFASRFLKQGEAESERPLYARALYQYLIQKTQSLADLEPFFSPIVKDIAFKAITKDVLEEL